MYRPDPDRMIAAMPDAILSIDGLRKSYGTTLAVDDVGFVVRRSEIFGLLGKNGAGKTSIFEMIEGLRTPDAGTLSLCGHDVARDPRKARAALGAMLQNSAFLAGLRLRELVDFYAMLKGCRVDARRRLAELDLADKGDALVRTLSGGQKQRFAFLIATLGDPALLLLDEPSAGLDVHARRQMWELIRARRDMGCTVLLSTHHMEEAEALCDRVAILHRGRVVAMDTPQRMIAALDWPAPGSPDHRRAATLEDVFVTLTPGGNEESTDA